MRTAEQLRTAIQNLTARIGRLKQQPDSEQAIRRARMLRASLAVILARDHGQWMLINPQGQTEFVGRREFESRMFAWLSGHQGGGEFGFRASLN